MHRSLSFGDKAGVLARRHLSDRSIDILDEWYLVRLVFLLFDVELLGNKNLVELQHQVDESTRNLGSTDVEVGPHIQTDHDFACAWGHRHSRRRLFWVWGTVIVQGRHEVKEDASDLAFSSKCRAMRSSMHRDT